MNIMTPAETASEIPRLVGFVRLIMHLKNRIIPPMQVDNPAANDKPKANATSGPVATMFMIVWLLRWYTLLKYIDFINWLKSQKVLLVTESQTINVGIEI